MIGYANMLAAELHNKICKCHEMRISRLITVNSFCFIEKYFLLKRNK
jgi:hypothetical protein